MRRTASTLFPAFLTAFVLSTAAYAEVNNAFPAGRFYPDPVALVYPGFNVAGGVNAAALPSAGRGTALQATYSPGGGSGTNQAFASVAHSGGNMGFNAGYQMNSGGGSDAHGVFAGLGANFSNFNVGLSLREYDVASNFSPNVDVGMVVELKVIDLGIVFYDLSGVTRLGVGVGNRSSQYNVEANVLLPPFSALTSNYLFTLSAQLELGNSAGVHFRTSYETGTEFISHTLGLGVFVTKELQLIAQYSTPSRFQGGMTIVF